MSKVRIIARLDIKGPNLIKGIHLEGLRVLGPPADFSKSYYEAGIDEIIYIDTVASLYGRNNLTDILVNAAQNVFIPMCVAGGIRSLEDATKLFRSGADKVALNTAATKNPKLLTEIAHAYGSQSVVLSIEAKMKSPGKWEAYTDNGREHTGFDVAEWARRGVDAGAGEVLLTSVDREGTKKGFDVELVQAVSSAVSVPVIASGGFGNLEHFEEVVTKGGANAVAIADAFHYKRVSVPQVRDFAKSKNISVRSI